MIMLASFLATKITGTSIATVLIYIIANYCIMIYTGSFMRAYGRENWRGFLLGPVHVPMDYKAFTLKW